MLPTNKVRGEANAGLVGALLSLAAPGSKAETGAPGTGTGTGALGIDIGNGGGTQPACGCIGGGGID